MATADTSIYGQFLQRPKSVDEYTADADAKESNRLQLMLQRGAVSDKMQAQERQRGLLRLMQGLPATATDEDRINALKGGAYFGEADALQKGILERQKTGADVAKANAETEKQRFATALDRQTQIARAAGAATDQASWERGLETVASLGVDVSKIPREYNPQLAATLAKQALTGVEQLEQHRKDLEFKAPKPTEVRAGDRVEFIDTNPNSPTYGQKVTPAVQIAQSPDNKATVGAAMAHAAAVADQAKATRDAANIQTGFKNEAELRKEFEGLPEVKNYKQAFPAFAAVKDAATRNTPQSDINIVYGIAKLYDPTSVVREGEYATVANSPNIPERIKGYAQYIAGGGRLTEKTKSDLLAEATGRIGTYQAEVGKAKGSYEGIAKRRGIDAANVFQDMGDLGAPAKPAAGVAKPAAAPTGGPWKPVAPGSVLRFDANGNLVQ